MAKDNVHDRHQVPGADEEFDTAQAPESQAPATRPKGPKFSWPGGNKQQEIRDAHFRENGVKADLTGGTAPEEGAADA